MTASSNAVSEWRSYWFLPIAAALGYATSVMYVYSMGPFIEPIQEAFGWSRARTSSGITIAAFISAIFCIPIGMLVDRVGPRRVGLLGVALISLAFGAMGTATGSGLNWIVLWLCLAVTTLLVQATVWTAAVNSRFERSRGLALAVTLSGASLAAALFPVTATWLIDTFNWRTAFMALSGGWFALIFPVLLFGFRGAHDQGHRQRLDTPAASRELPGLSLSQGLRSPALYKLLMAGGFFAFTALGVVVHFVPILTDSGADKMNAAGVASLIGIFSVVGRLGTGVLLDRFRGHLVGTCASAIPIVASSLLLWDGTNPVNQTLAAILFGLTLGSEVDVIAYLAAKYFGLRNFGALYGALVMALSLGTAFGPLGAGALHDYFGSYNEFLILIAILMAASALALLSLGATPSADQFLAQENSDEPDTETAR